MKIIIKLKIFVYCQRCLIQVEVLLLILAQTWYRSVILATTSQKQVLNEPHINNQYIN